MLMKKATFHSLLSPIFWKSVASHGIIITVSITMELRVSRLRHNNEQGKGYPDIATRAFLQRLSKTMGNREAPPVYGLVDYDPDGLGILATYKHGSIALTHENAALVVPNFKWLGLRSSDISLASDMVMIDSEHEATFNLPRQSQGLLQLSLRDRKKAVRMMQWRHVEDASPDIGWRRELQLMLMLNVKAEIQLLDTVDGGLLSWLIRRMASL